MDKMSLFQILNNAPDEPAGLKQASTSSSTTPEYWRSLDQLADTPEFQQWVHREFPDYPPFAGKFTTVVPHVTVAHADEPQLCEIEVELRIALASGGGIAAHCSEMILIENSSGRWEEVQAFPLGAS